MVVDSASSPDTSSGAVARFVALIEGRFDEFVEFAVARTLDEADERYRELAAERLRASLSRGLRAVLDDLGAGGAAAFSEFWRTIAGVRARAGFPISALQQALDLNEGLLVTVAKQLPEPEAQLAVVEGLHRVHNAARRAQFESYAAVSAEIQAEQQAALDRLGVPVIPVYRGVVLVPLVGASALTQLGGKLLAAVQEHRVRFVVLDVTGLLALDGAAAETLARTGQGVRLLGAELLLVGVSPAAAAGLVAAGMSLAHVAVFRDLQSGFEHALARLGLGIGAR